MIDIVVKEKIKTAIKHTSHSKKRTRQRTKMTGNIVKQRIYKHFITPRMKLEYSISEKRYRLYSVHNCYVLSEDFHIITILTDAFDIHQRDYVELNKKQRRSLVGKFRSENEL